jgi:hypothetical protein
MPETTRRVNVTFTFDTDAEHDHVMRQALESLPDAQAACLETVSVHTFDLDEPGEDEQTVHLVADLASGTVSGHASPLRAHEYARNVGAVVLELPVAADYRKPGETR